VDRQLGKFIAFGSQFLLYRRAGLSDPRGVSPLEHISALT